MEGRSPSIKGNKVTYAKRAYVAELSRLQRSGHSAQPPSRNAHQAAVTSLQTPSCEYYPDIPIPKVSCLHWRQAVSMRGFSKAALLLSSVYASASAAPRSQPAEPVEAADYVIKYSECKRISIKSSRMIKKLTCASDESEASVVFQVLEPIAPGVALPV